MRCCVQRRSCFIIIMLIYRNSLFSSLSITKLCREISEDRTEILQNRTWVDGAGACEGRRPWRRPSVTKLRWWLPTYAIGRAVDTTYPSAAMSKSSDISGKPIPAGPRTMLFAPPCESSTLDASTVGVNMTYRQCWQRGIEQGYQRHNFSLSL